MYNTRKPSEMADPPAFQGTLYCIEARVRIVGIDCSHLNNFACSVLNFNGSSYILDLAPKCRGIIKLMHSNMASSPQTKKPGQKSPKVKERSPKGQ